MDQAKKRSTQPAMDTDNLCDLAEQVAKQIDLDSLADLISERLAVAGYQLVKQSAEAKQQEHELDRMPQYMTPADVQAVLRISRATFFRLVSSGEMPGAVKIGNSWRVDRGRLREYLQ